jgi:MEDS: MEthanogen/methylotroph, DcmR Sensory domain
LRTDQRRHHSSSPEAELENPVCHVAFVYRVHKGVVRVTDAVPSGIDQIDLQPGSHACAFYRGDDDRDRLLTAYLGAGLTAGGKCICIVDSLYTQKRLTSLPGAGGGTGPSSGQLDVHLPESTYMAGGRFTASDMLAFWRRPSSGRRMTGTRSAAWPAR